MEIGIVIDKFYIVIGICICVDCGWIGSNYIVIVG